jgi:hypothetical protein
LIISTERLRYRETTFVAKALRLFERGQSGSAKALFSGIDVRSV